MDPRCWLFGHDTETKVVLDIPLGMTDPKYLHEGWICMEKERCKRCHTTVRHEPVEPTEERLEKHRTNTPL